MGRTTKRIGLTQRGSDEGGSTSRTSKQIEDYYSGGKRKFSYKKNDRGKIVKIPQMLTGGQAKIAAKAPPPNKIDAKDFAVLRAEKAKGRGMGLQDESVKPGKVMKAKRGSGINLPQEGSRIVFNTYSKPFKGPRDGGRVSAIVGVKPGAKIKGQRKKFKSMEEMRKAKGFKPGESSSEFMKRRKELAGATKALKATRIGKIVLPIAAAGVAASQYLKSKMKKKDEPKKKMGGGMMKKYSKGGGSDMGKSPTSKMKVAEIVRTYALANSMKNKDRLTDRDIKKAKELVKGKMGGGMMQKPMGYSKGVSVKARGCKLGRTRPTKIT